jgi:hypothetical protein
MATVHEFNPETCGEKCVWCRNRMFHMTVEERYNLGFELIRYGLAHQCILCNEAIFSQAMRVGLLKCDHFYHVECAAKTLKMYESTSKVLVCTGCEEETLRAVRKNSLVGWIKPDFTLEVAKEKQFCCRECHGIIGRDTNYVLFECDCKAHTDCTIGVLIRRGISTNGDVFCRNCSSN